MSAPAAPMVRRHDHGAEKFVLGGSMRNPEAFRTAEAILTRADFGTEPHRLVWDVLRANVHAKKPTSYVALRDEIGRLGQINLVNGGDYLFELEQAGDVVTAENVEYYADIVKGWADLWLGRSLAAALELAATEIDPQPDTLNKLIAEHQQRMRDRAGSNHRLDKYALDGWDFIEKAQETRNALWGTPKLSIWPQGESLMICGKPGIGKTTLIQQVAMASIGIFDTVLNQPVTQAEMVLYLAMDRPDQIGRALGRLVRPQDEKLVRARLKVWRGPLPAALDKEPHLLAELADRHGADRVIIDSLKDCVTKLADDEAALAYNSARQNALRDGIDVGELHHQRKRSGDDAVPKSQRPELDQVYGSTWFTSGAGSVLFLTGTQGDPEVKLWHLKQSIGELGPLNVVHDYERGTSAVKLANGEITNEMVQNELLLLKVMQECYADITATSKELMIATALPATSLHRARRGLASKGLIINIGTEKLPKYKLSDGDSK